jgi:hypothetical protein
MGEPLQLRRDPFGRRDLMRRSVKTKLRCACCGHQRKNNTLFRYWWEGDGIGQNQRIQRILQEQGPLFCSVGCWETYFNEPTVIGR